MKHRLAFLGLAWLGAFVIVTALFLILGDFLGGLSLPLRALIVSGVLVFTMTQAVIPLILRVIGPPPRPHRKVD